MNIVDNKVMSMIDIYKALADETRLRILHVLETGSFNVQELTNVLDATQSNVSHHLKTLQSAGIIESQKEGTWVYYKLTNGNSPSGLITKNCLQVSKVEQNGLPQIFSSDAEQAKKLLDLRRDEARRYFDSVAPNWKELRGEMVDSYSIKLKELIPEDTTLLELGCGSGALLEELCPRSGETIAVDYSSAMLDEAKKSLANEKIDFRLGYLEHLPLADNSVDVAVAHMVLHHIPKPEDALKDAYRVLKPGGRLIVVDLISHSDESMRERHADLWLGFDPKEFKNWVIKSNFSAPFVSPLKGKREAFILTATKGKV